MSLADKFIKEAKKSRGSGLLSKVFEAPKTMYDTGIPALNLAYSGRLDGGISDGISCLAGKSKSFKTLFGLISCKAYLDAHEDAYMIFYDSEGGADSSYFEGVGIDPDRVICIRIMNIEDLKFDIVEKLEEIKAEMDEKKTQAHFIFFIDSVGNLASKKEVEDAKKESSAMDMGIRAKVLKGLFRILTPYFVLYNLKLIPIMHTYDEMAAMGAPKQIMSGGQGPMLSSNDVFIVGKRQIKEGKDIIGWQFILNVEKSRFIRERAAIPFDVTYEGGINKYSGLLDMAIITGHVNCPKMGWYTRTGIEGDKNWRRKETSSSEFWDPLLNSDDFKNAVHSLYSLNANPLMIERMNQAMSDDAPGLEDISFDAETGEILE